MRRSYHLSALCIGCILIFTSCSLLQTKGNCTQASLQDFVVSDTLRFLALGDWGRNGRYNQKKLAQTMEWLASQKKIDFILSLGDNFYPDGVSSVNDRQWKTSFEKIYNGENLKQIPWIVTLGNHDYLSDPTAEIAYSKKCTRWFMPDYFYTVTIPLKATSIRLVVIDTNPFERRSYRNPKFDGKFVIDSTRQKQWLDSVLTLHDTDWTIVSGHHPLYTGGRRVLETNYVRSSLAQLFAKRSVEIYFSGHEHDLQHIQTSHGFNQFISGAGSELRPTGSMPFTKFAASINGLISAEVTQYAMDVYFISYQSDTLYHTRIPRN